MPVHQHLPVNPNLMGYAVHHTCLQATMQTASAQQQPFGMQQQAMGGNLSVARRARGSPKVRVKEERR